MSQSGVATSEPPLLHIGLDVFGQFKAKSPRFDSVYTFTAAGGGVE
jgi:hypothetical protein